MTTETTTAVAVGGPDVSISKWEMIDVDFARWIVENKDIDKDHRDAVRKVLKKERRKGFHEVHYKLGKDLKHQDLGRWIAMGGVGLQSLPRDCRAALAQKSYFDVDMRNAQPTLLMQYAAKRGWVHEKLKSFCENREEHISELMEALQISRDEAKDKLIALMFGGSFDNLTPFFSNELKPEMFQIRKNIMTENQHKYPSMMKKPNPMGSMMSLILQTEERKCLMALDMSLAKQGRSMDVLIHDGGLVRKKEGETFFPEEILRKAEKDILEQTEYRVSLVVKELRTSFVRDAEEEGFVEVGTVVDDAYAARKFCELMGEHLVMDTGEVWVFNKDTGMWSNERTALERVITSLNGSLVFRQQGAMGVKVYDYSGCVEKRNCLIKMLPSVAPMQNGYFRSRIASDRGKLLFVDGIYDFNTGVFTEGFDPNIVFRHACPRRFPRVADREKINFIQKMCFEEPFRDPKEAVRIRHNLMRASTGERRKKCVTALGPKNSGKSMLILLMKTAFGDYVETFSANSMLLRHGGEAARDMLWIHDIHDRRFAFSSEIKQDDSAKMPSIDGNMLKSLVSGVDEVNFRKMHSNNATRVFFLPTIFMMANDMPKIVPCSEEIKDRIDVVDYHYSFQIQPTELHHKKADTTLDKKFVEDGYGDAMIWLLIEEFNKWKEEGFPELPPCENDVQDDMMEMVDVKNILLGDYELTGDPEHTVETKDIQAYLRRHGFVGSETKITREMKQIGLGVQRIQKHRQKVKVYTGIRLAPMGSP